MANAKLDAANRRKAAWKKAAKWYRQMAGVYKRGCTLRDVIIEEYRAMVDNQREQIEILKSEVERQIIGRDTEWNNACLAQEWRDEKIAEQQKQIDALISSTKIAVEGVAEIDHKFDEAQRDALFCAKFAALYEGNKMHIQRQRKKKFEAIIAKYEKSEGDS